MSQFYSITQEQMFAIPPANLRNLDFYYATDTRSVFIVLFNGLQLLTEFAAGIQNYLQGAAWHEGSGVPSAGLGNNGDFYLNGSTGDVYTKTLGSWGTPVCNIKGPAGPAGSTTLAGCTDASISGPTNGEVLTYNSGASKWENAAPSGGAPAGSNIAVLPDFGQYNNAGNPQNGGFYGSGGWNGWSLMTAIPDGLVMNAAKGFTIDVRVSGAGLKVNKAVIQKWNPWNPSSGWSSPVATAPITWGGNASPTLNDGSNVSDAISFDINAQYLYQIIVYFDASGSSSALLYYGITSGNSSYVATWTAGQYVWAGDASTYLYYPVALGVAITQSGYTFYVGLRKISAA